MRMQEVLNRSGYAVVIAARQGSTRLPGKALVRYNHQTNLEQIISRWKALSRRSPEIIVMTTVNGEDDAVEAQCNRSGVLCYRGAEFDVLGNVHGAIERYAPDAEYIARGLADNPLVDVELVDWRVDLLRESGCDGVWHGMDGERITYAGTTDVWSRSAWERIAAESTGEQREHPGLYFWDNLSRFNVTQMCLPRREYLQPVRTELDTPADLEMFRAVFGWWEREQPYPDEVLPTIEALCYLERHPVIADLNRGVPLKTQTKPHFKGSVWLCRNCQELSGVIVAGDLVVNCPRCGRAQKFYAHKQR